jgi:hypothetical protein
MSNTERAAVIAGATGLVLGGIVLAHSPQAAQLIEMQAAKDAGGLTKVVLAEAKVIEGPGGEKALEAFSHLYSKGTIVVADAVAIPEDAVHAVAVQKGGFAKGAKAISLLGSKGAIAAIPDDAVAVGNGEFVKGPRVTGGTNLGNTAKVTGATTGASHRRNYWCKCCDRGCC